MYNMLSPVYQYSEPWMKEVMCSRCEKNDGRKKFKHFYRKADDYDRGYKWEMIENENGDVARKGGTKQFRGNEGDRIGKKTFVMSVDVLGVLTGKTTSRTFKEILEVKEEITCTDSREIGFNISQGMSMESSEAEVREKIKIVALTNFKCGSIICSLSKVSGENEKGLCKKREAFNLGGLLIEELFSGENDSSGCKKTEGNAVLTKSGVLRCLCEIKEGEEIVIVRKIKANHPFNFLDCLILSETYMGAVASTSIGKVIDFDGNYENPLFTVAYSDNRVELLSRKDIIDRVLYAERK